MDPEDSQISTLSDPYFSDDQVAAFNRLFDIDPKMWFIHAMTTDRKEVLVFRGSHPNLLSDFFSRAAGQPDKDAEPAAIAAFAASTAARPIAARLGALLGGDAETAETLIEQAFMTGIMSLMPTLLGQRIEDILAQLPVSPAMVQALSDTREGPLGNLLKLAEASEAADCEQIEAVLPSLYGLNVTVLNNARSQSLAWANNIGREAEN